MNATLTLDEPFDYRAGFLALEKKLKEREEKLRPARVLVVDDDKDEIFLTLKLLEAFDCICTACNDSSRAVDLICSGDYDLVLIDLKMPGMDGVEVIEQAMSRTSKMARVVVMTAMPINPTVDRTLRLGAVWSGKPLTSQILKTFLRTK